MQRSLTGVIPPMITPFQDSGDVDFAAFARNIRRWNSARLAGYLVLGSNSETPYLSAEEKLELVRITVAEAAPGRLVMAGTGAESTRETIRMTNSAASCGAHAALVLTPSYYGTQMTDEALVAHFTAVADAAEIPILVYNVPKFTHLNIGVGVLEQLSRHGNIFGIKDSAGDPVQLAQFRSRLPESFQIIAGNAAVWRSALAIGLRSGILALSNCAPDLCAEVQRLHDAGNEQAAAELHTLLLPLNQAVTATYGIAGLKYACGILGYEGGAVRAPLRPLTETGKEAIRTIIADAGIAIPQ